jgi:hypothetical protein
MLCIDALVRTSRKHSKEGSVDCYHLIDLCATLFLH